MRGVSHKQQTLVAEVFHAAALEGVNADPFQLEILLAKHGAQARQHAFGFAFFFRVGIPTQLKVNAPDVVGLLVQQHALTGVKLWVKPHATFGGKVSLHHHVGNQEAVFENMTFNVQPQVATHGTARAIGHHQPIGFHIKRAFGGFKGEARMIGLGTHAHGLAFPTNVHAEFERTLNQRLFQVVLLQVDHARALVARFWHQVELVDLFILQKGAANVPAHTLFTQGLAHAQTVQHF